MNTHNENDITLFRIVTTTTANFELFSFTTVIRKLVELKPSTLYETGFAKNYRGEASFTVDLITFSRLTSEERHRKTFYSSGARQTFSVRVNA